MDDNKTRLQVEFPVGAFTVTVLEPTGEQMFVLGVSREPRNDKEQAQLVERLVRILRRLTGEQWFSVIESNLIDEEMTVTDVLTLTEDIMRFPWAEHHKTTGTPPEPEQPVTEAPERPAPRVVGSA